MKKENNMNEEKILKIIDSCITIEQLNCVHKWFLDICLKYSNDFRYIAYRKLLGKKTLLTND